MKITKNISRKSVVKAAAVLTAGVTMLLSTPVMAAGFADIFNNISGQFPAFMKMFTIGLYVVGGILVGKALLDFKKHSDNPQQIKLSSAFIALIVGLAMITFPMTVLKSSESVYGSGAQSQGIQGTDNILGN